LYCGVGDGCGYVIAQQIVGAIACVLWAMANSGALIWLLSRMQLMRVDLADEMAGLDSVNHGGAVNMSPAPVADSSAMPVFSFAKDQRSTEMQQVQVQQQQMQIGQLQPLSVLAQLQSLQEQYVQDSAKHS
jgi:hypothetical protein